MTDNSNAQELRALQTDIHDDGKRHKHKTKYPFSSFYFPLCPMILILVLSFVHVPTIL